MNFSFLIFLQHGDLFDMLIAKVFAGPSDGRLAQLARAPALHAGGHRFKSCIAHCHKIRRKRILR